MQDINRWHYVQLVFTQNTQQARPNIDCKVFSKGANSIERLIWNWISSWQHIDQQSVSLNCNRLTNFTTKMCTFETMLGDRLKWLSIFSHSHKRAKRCHLHPFGRPLVNELWPSDEGKFQITFDQTQSKWNEWLNLQSTGTRIPVTYIVIDRIYVTTHDFRLILFNFLLVDFFLFISVCHLYLSFRFLRYSFRKHFVFVSICSRVSLCVCLCVCRAICSRYRRIQ